MYSLSISFGPTGTVWAFLFKEEKNGIRMQMLSTSRPEGATHFSITDDFGQTGNFAFAAVNGTLFEDLDQIEEARIQRSLADERCKAKFMVRAKSDPVIRQAMGQGPGIVSPFPR